MLLSILLETIEEARSVMLTKPDLNDDDIISRLNTAYGLTVKTIQFLPLGADFNTAVYQVTTTDDNDYFLKCRWGEFLDASILVPHYLANQGMREIIAPIETLSGLLWVDRGLFKMILYPYISGKNAVDMGLSDHHWIQWGTALKKLHSTEFPIAMTQDVSRESFSSKWRERVKHFLERVEHETFEEAIATSAAAFLKSKRSELLKRLTQGEDLEHDLQRQEFEMVLCHADIHGWNLFIDQSNNLYIVDWDTLLFAPKERDLMFIGSKIWDSGRPSSEEISLFFQGYGPCEINQAAIEYFRLERSFQDICEYCEFLFDSSEGGDDRSQSLNYLVQLLEG